MSRPVSYLTEIGIGKALRSIAALVGGVHEPDHALEFCENIGLIVPHPDDRERIILTPNGEKMVHAFWQVMGEGIEEAKAA